MKRIDILKKKMILKFNLEETASDKNRDKNDLNTLTEEKAKKKQFFQKIKNKNFSQTPVFGFFIALIIFINTIMFMSSFLNFFALEGLDKDYFPLFFGANHSSSIIEGKQLWRIISFPFIEKVIGLHSIFVAFFIWLTYWRVGYYQEIFIGSKKIAIIYGIGIPVIGISQFLLTKNEVIYFYGTEYLSLLGLGALTFHYLTEQEKNEQSKALIKSIVWKSILFIFIFGVIKYTQTYNSIENKALLKIANYYLTYPILAFLTGFFLNMLLNYKKLMTKNIFSIYIAIGFFVILILAWITTGYLLLTKWNLGENTWKIVEKFY